MHRSNLNPSSGIKVKEIEIILTTTYPKLGVITIEHRKVKLGQFTRRHTPELPDPLDP
jgi:hypothetical protein